MRDFLKKNLRTDSKWMIKALMVIFSYQTVDEQRIEQTTLYNEIGFTGVDAEILSSFAKQIKNGRGISEKQINLLRIKMPKYWKQILLTAERKDGGEKLKQAYYKEHPQISMSI